MRVSATIARRISFKGKPAAAATAISAFVMIVAVSVSGGFRAEIMNAVSGRCGDISIESSNGHFIPDPALTDLILSYPGVESIREVVSGSGILKTDDEIEGALFRGIPAPDLQPLQIEIPQKTASRLNLGEGSEVNAFFISERVKARRFTVCGTDTDAVDFGDEGFTICRIDDLRRIDGLADNEVSALEVILEAGHRTEKGIEAAAVGIAALCPGYQVSASTRKYASLFDWLRLIDGNVNAIILLMSIVAGFNMIAGLLILLMRNISVIGTLKTLGMKSRNISEVFLRASSSLCLKGLAIGNAAALIFCFLQGRFHFLKLNPANYFVSFVPVKTDLAAILATDAVAWLIIMALLSFCSLMVAKTDPAKTVKAD